MKYPHKLQAASIILSLLMIISLFCGCARSAPGNDPTYETYTASALQDTAPSTNEISPDIQKAREDFDRLCDDLFHEQLSDNYLSLHYSLADPAPYGLDDCPRSFGDFSLALLQEASDTQKEQKSRLDAISVDLLSEEQQLTYQILKSAFESEEAFHGLELYYQPLAPTVGLQAQLPVLLAEYIFYDKEDIEDYLALLSTIDIYYGQILEFEQEKAKEGLFMTDDCVDTIAAECSAYLAAPSDHFLAATFNDRIDAMTGISDEEKAAYKGRNLQVLSEHFIPAYELLLNGLKELKGTCTNELGLSYYPEGKQYYEYLVHSSTGTTYETIDKLRDAIDNQIKYDMAAIYKLILDHEELSEQLDHFQFSYTEPGEILEQLKEVILKDFPALPDCNYTTKYVPESLEGSLSPAFFLVPPMDRYKDCVIYINRGSVNSSENLYTTLAHEGYPGHLYQNVYFLSNCNSSLRKVLSFGSYSEGWATYVENYAYTADNNGLSPELGQLLAYNASATLGLHALLDININYYGWDKEQVASYLSENFGITDRETADQIFQYMLSAPVNYLDYYVGYLEIRHMKEQAERTLKTKFILKDFHQFILDIGPAPFTVIKPYFNDWLKSCSAK